MLEKLTPKAVFSKYCRKNEPVYRGFQGICRKCSKKRQTKILQITKNQ
jgi:hypothetical protein